MNHHHHLHYIYVMSNQSTPNILRIGLSFKHPNLKAQDFNYDLQYNAFMVEYVISTNMGIKLKRDIHKRLQEYRISNDNDDDNNNHNDHNEFFQISKDDVLLILTREFNLYISTIDKIVCNSTNPNYGSKLNRLIRMCDDLERNVFQFFQPMFMKENVDIFVTKFYDKKYVSFIELEQQELISTRCCLDIHGLEEEDERRIKMSYYFIRRDVENFMRWLHNLIIHHVPTNDDDNEESEGWFEEMIVATKETLHDLQINYIWEL
jgi:hypothetical protein